MYCAHVLSVFVPWHWQRWSFGLSVLQILGMRPIILLTLCIFSFLIFYFIHIYIDDYGEVLSGHLFNLSFIWINNKHISYFTSSLLSTWIIIFSYSESDHKRGSLRSCMGISFHFSKFLQLGALLFVWTLKYELCHCIFLLGKSILLPEKILTHWINFWLDLLP